MTIRSRSALLSIATFVFAVTSLMCQALTKPDYPVIFIHGITGSADETWGDFKSFLVTEGWQFGGSPTYSAASKQVSSVSAGDFYTMNMSDYDRLLFKSQSLTLGEQGWEIAAAVAKVLAANPNKTRVILVAHSMGGLASRSYLQGLAKKDGASVSYRRDVAKLITVDTPHQGTELATLCQEFRPFGVPVCSALGIDPKSVAVAEMRSDSPAFSNLNNLSANPLPGEVSYVSIIGTGLRLLLFPNQTGDGIVSAASQNLGNVAGVNLLTHIAKELIVLPRSDCDLLKKLDPLNGNYVSHACATGDGGVHAELIRQLRPGSSAELRGLSITGPQVISENSSVEFTAIALFSDGSSQPVTPTWSEDSLLATISSAGVLTVGSVTIDTTVTVSASFTASSVTRTSRANVPVVKAGVMSTQKQELITNGGFEDGFSSWQIANVVLGVTVSTGNHRARLGGSSTHSLSQSIAIPANATSVTLTFDLEITSSTGSRFMDVNIRSASGAFLGNLVTYSSADSGPSRPVTLDLTKYRGQTVLLEFETNFSTGGSLYYIDDVSVRAAVPAPVALSSLFINGPSALTEGTAAQYSATAIFTDGSTNIVTPTWSENSMATTISSTGLLTAGQVSSDTTVTLRASYSDNGIARDAYKDLTVVTRAITYSLTVLASNGSVAKSPDQTTYVVGGSVKLTAVPATGYEFSGWSGDASGTNSPLVITMDRTKTIAANFTGIQSGRGYTFTTLAGAANSPGSADGTVSAARFDGPIGVAVDAAGNIYVADHNNHTIRKITPGGMVSTLAGLPGNSGSADGIGSAARFKNPDGLAIDNAGNVYLSDRGNYTIRRITPDGRVVTLAGLAGWWGLRDDVGDKARFSDPSGVALDADRNVYVTDDSFIRKITPGGQVTTPGSCAPGQRGHIAVSRDGNIYVAELVANYITRLTANGCAETVAGAAFERGNTDGIASMARFYNPQGLAFDQSGNLFVTERGNNTLRKIAPDGVVSTIGGLAGVSGSSDGRGSMARFFQPSGIAVDSTGDLYVADKLNHTIRKGVLFIEPNVTVQPQSQLVRIGANTALSVSVTGTSPFAYQWYFDGNPVPGATSSVLALTNARPELTGSYFVVVSNSIGVTTSHAAILQLLNTPPRLTVPSSQTINEFDTLSVTSFATDDDIPANALMFSLVSAPAGVSIDPSTGVVTWIPNEAQGPSTNIITMNVTDNGVPTLSATNSFTVVVNEVNSAPVLTVPDTQTTNEFSTLTASVAATDADLPLNSLTFSLVSAPPGASIHAASGVITWIPSEVHGSTTNVITVRVTDNGTPPLSATNNITVIVNEVNSSPSLIAVPDQAVAEGAQLSFPVSATDADLPGQQFTFNLEPDAPAGARIDPATGVFSWTPGEAQGPSTNRITVRVTDNGSPSLSDITTFTAVVNEVNSPPVIVPIADKFVEGKTKLEFKIEATDADIPKNGLVFSLAADAPAGSSIDPKGGVFSWVVGDASIAQTNRVTVRVTDDGAAPMTATNTFFVVITPSRLRLAPIPDFTLDEGGLLTFTAATTNSPLAIPPFSYSLEASAPAGATIAATTGAFFWRPTEAQGPSTNTITVRVTDGSSPPLSTAQSFTVVVREVNRAPVLAAVARQTNVVGRTLTLQLSATDEDLPANTFTFNLEPGAPTGASIDAVTGVFTWTSGPASAPSTNSIAVRVTDNGTPVLSATTTFVVVVLPPGELILSISLLSSGQFQITLLNTEPGRTYFIEASAILRDWDLLTNVVSVATRVEFTDSASLGGKQRFYRAVSP